MQGWLAKRYPPRYAGAIDKWHPRWCVLKSTLLTVYNDDTCKKLNFRCGITASSRAVAFADEACPGDGSAHCKERPFGFVLDLKPDAGSSRDLYYFDALEGVLMQDWMQALNECASADEGNLLIISSEDLQGKVGSNALPAQMIGSAEEDAELLLGTTHTSSLANAAPKKGTRKPPRLTKLKASKPNPRPKVAILEPVATELAMVEGELAGPPTNLIPCSSPHLTRKPTPRPKDESPDPTAEAADILPGDTVQWMWADAGTGFLGHSLAQQDPLRWSDWSEIDATIIDLANFEDYNRPVEIRIKRTMDILYFDNIDKALLELGDQASLETRSSSPPPEPSAFFPAMVEGELPIPPTNVIPCSSPRMMKLKASKPGPRPKSENPDPTDVEPAMVEGELSAPPGDAIPCNSPPTTKLKPGKPSPKPKDESPDPMASEPAMVEGELTTPPTNAIPCNPARMTKLKASKPGPRLKGESPDPTVVEPTMVEGELPAPRMTKLKSGKPGPKPKGENPGPTASALANGEGEEPAPPTNVNIHKTKAKAGKSGPRPKGENPNAVAAEPAKAKAELPTPPTNANFGELTTGKGCAIARTEERGTNLQQLRALMRHVKRRCLSEKWCDISERSPTCGQPLALATLNLYHVVDWVVKPFTKEQQVSYVEMVADSPQKPRWFVSHWWGEAHTEFVMTIAQHAQDRSISDLDNYWICAYANNQWVLTGDVATDPAESSFRRAMDMCEGTVSCLDIKASCYTRIWCSFELFTSLVVYQERDPPYLYDAYIASKGRSVGLTDGMAYADMVNGEEGAVFWKSQREHHFPIRVSKRIFGMHLEKAQASCDDDRRHILNAMVGSEDLEADPPTEHEKYNEANEVLRGRFAAAAWRRALEAGESMEEFRAALAVSRLTRLSISLSGCTTLGAGGVEMLTKSLPDTIKNLDLDFSGCDQADSDALKSLAISLQRMSTLSRLRLILDSCHLVPDPVGVELLQALKSETLEDLNLDISACRQLASNTAAEIAALPASLPNLMKLHLDLKGFRKFEDASLVTLAKNIPFDHITALHLNLSSCVCITDNALKEMARAWHDQVAIRLQDLALRFGGCRNLTRKGALYLAKNLPKSSLARICFSFEGCPNVDGIEVQRYLKEKHPNANLQVYHR